MFLILLGITRKYVGFCEGVDQGGSKLAFGWGDLGLREGSRVLGDRVRR